MSASTSIGFSLCLIAVSGSLSPCPVVTQTTRSSLHIMPFLISLFSPAMDDALAGSTNIPSMRARIFCACENFFVCDGFGCAVGFSDGVDCFFPADWCADADGCSEGFGVFDRYDFVAVRFYGLCDWCGTCSLDACHFGQFFDVSQVCGIQLGLSRWR